jgi:hypothetical protein
MTPLLSRPIGVDSRWKKVATDLEHVLGEYGSKLH